MLEEILVLFSFINWYLLINFFFANGNITSLWSKLHGYYFRHSLSILLSSVSLLQSFHSSHKDKNILELLENGEEILPSDLELCTFTPKGAYIYLLETLHESLDINWQISIFLSKYYLENIFSIRKKTAYNLRWPSVSSIVNSRDGTITCTGI